MRYPRAPRQSDQSLQDVPPATCAFCARDFPQDELAEHEARCPERIVRCTGDGCDWEGPLRLLPAHTEFCVMALATDAVAAERQRQEAERQELRKQVALLELWVACTSCACGCDGARNKPGSRIAEPEHEPTMCY